MPKKIDEMRYAELLEDIKINGGPLIPKGTKFEVAKSNSRYAYLQWNRCLLRIARSKIKAIKKKSK